MKNPSQQSDINEPITLEELERKVDALKNDPITDPIIDALEELLIDKIIRLLKGGQPASIQAGDSSVVARVINGNVYINSEEGSQIRRRPDEIGPAEPVPPIPVKPPPEAPRSPKEPEATEGETDVSKPGDQEAGEQVQIPSTQEEDDVQTLSGGGGAKSAQKRAAVGGAEGAGNIAIETLTGEEIKTSELTEEQKKARASLQRLHELRLKREESEEATAESLKLAQNQILELVQGLQYREGDPGSSQYHLYGFWEQLHEPENIGSLLRRVEELSCHPTSHELFAGKDFEKVLKGLSEQQLSELKSALEWVKHEGLMSHFDFERAQHNVIFLLSDTSGESFADVNAFEAYQEKAVLTFQLTSHADLKEKRVDAVKRIIRVCNELGFDDVRELEDLPPIVHAAEGLMLFLNDMGTLNGESRFNIYPHKIDVTTANLLVLASAIESGILTPNDQKTVLRFKKSETWIFYDRYKEFPSQSGFSDIPKIESEKKAKRFFPQY